MRALDGRLEALRDLARDYDRVRSRLGCTAPVRSLAAEMRDAAARLSHDFARLPPFRLPQALCYSAVRLYLAAPDREAFLRATQGKLESALRTADALAPSAMAACARSAIRRPLVGPTDEEAAARVVALLLAGLDGLGAATESEAAE
ncbi:MAG TPA: hypothetical protein VFS43_09705 [Polyangiaceae bacterium]|nr:hypothetical protein [Polyangiaceae bacterium]